MHWMRGKKKDFILFPVLITTWNHIQQNKSSSVYRNMIIKLKMIPNSALLHVNVMCVDDAFQMPISIIYEDTIGCMCSLVAPLFFLFFFWLGWTTCGSEWPTRISRPLITTGKQKRMRDGWEGVVVLGPFWLFFFFGSFAYISFRTATINI